MLAALLTPPGRGAIAVVHVVGAGSGALIGSLLGRPVGERPRTGELTSGGEVLDEVLVRRVPGFTGEETVEITCHGGKATIERLLGALGLPRAGAEELLERGVGTGHLDRIQAEGWQLLPGALTERAAGMLEDQAQGALSRAVRTLESARQARELLETARYGAALARPQRVVIAGLPNAGKSTLFNALVQADRAIVSPEPGTTRDPVREWIALEGIPLELVDTAGVEEPRDALERMSIDRTHRALEGADLVLFVSDARAGFRDEEVRLLESLQGRRVIVVASKVDCGAGLSPRDVLCLSARTGQGMGDLRRLILQDLGAGSPLPMGAPVVFTARQERLLERAVQTGELEAARGMLLRGPCA